MTVHSFIAQLELVPYLDGNEWCILWGENIQEGVVGFGRTPALALESFNEAMCTPASTISKSLHTNLLVCTKRFSEAESCNVAEISYSESRGDFDIEFRNGGRYRYFNVPPNVVIDALNAKTIGAFISVRIKRFYSYIKM